MNAATSPRHERDRQRLLVVDVESRDLRDHLTSDLPELLLPGDLLVVNDAATLPASLSTVTDRDLPVELRLVRPVTDGFEAVALGEGDWRTPTERRGPPPELPPGMTLRVLDAAGNALLCAIVQDVEPVASAGSRWIRVRFDRTGARFWMALYDCGRPIQYAYLDRSLALWDVQNVFASRPWAFELPSASHGLSWQVLLELRRRGIGLAWVTHAAGISSTGSDELDRKLPVSERFEVGAQTAARVRSTRAEGRRVIASGTSVVRALETAAASGELIAQSGQTALLIGPGYRPRVVDGILSGIHAPDSTHFRLLRAFAPDELLDRSISHARLTGYLGHEFGDACLVLSR